jgi:hypothetical protein
MKSFLKFWMLSFLIVEDVNHCFGVRENVIIFEVQYIIIF